MNKDIFLQWAFEYRGKPYGFSIAKGNTKGVTDKQTMLAWIDKVAEQMKQMKQTVENVE